MKYNSVLVTGGAGFIGSALSSYLADNCGKVVALDNLHPQVHPTHEPALGFHPGVELIEGDITDAATWDALLPKVKPDLIIHLAAETGTGQSLTESTRHSMVNVVGTSVMLDALKRHDIIPDKFLLCSSRAVYGEGLWEYVEGLQTGTAFYPGIRSRKMFEAHQWEFAGARPLPMNAQHAFHHAESVYGVTKCAQEDLLRLWADAFGAKVDILRLQNVYGPGQTPQNPYTGIMSLFTNLARSGQAIPLYEDGNVRRDFIFIDDVVRACIAAIERVESLPFPMDIGSGSYTTIREAAEIIAEIYGAPKPYITHQWRHGDVRHAWADPEPAKQYLNFTSQVGIRDGFRRLANWIDSVSE
ncbi:NAD-dependent epimerase/dehydratase family protein [Arcanobacterium bovis]|uniref:NAD(P)-dependent oxidoreductase n=1 Tax=Arcanobacterium bovis TaxID=2529275 RepID=A0A4Q9V1Y6_9ACTO|nr:NAD(P)-dependent oxidoreductase [Arcanobacterium bovis]TBW23641.1 NAD(P)-dependent oxidoreductase [Arcanobacterium bovis]